MKGTGKGTTLSVGGDLVAEIKSFGGLEINRAMHDVTTHDSPDNYVEKIAGLMSVGDIPISGVFDSEDTDGQLSLVSKQSANSAQACVVTLPAGFGISWSFNAWISSVKIGDANHDGEVPFSATFSVTGKPTLSTAVSAGLTTPFFALSDSAVIVPTIETDVYEYVANVLTGVSSITVTPTATAGEIKVNGSVVESGVASSAIPLNAAGTMTDIEIEVTEANKAPKTYTIHVARAAA